MSQKIKTFKGLSIQRMLESITADIVENTSLLERIYRCNELPPEADNAIACLIRSMKKTNETVCEYIEQLSHSQTESREVKSFDIADNIFDVVVTAKKLEALAQTYSESYFTDKDNDNPACYMAATMLDYANKVCDELKNIQSKIN
ncbi:TPA: hypothetical protein I8O92_001992 [Salmonella enterica subsp. enterica serovar Napoli]|nr:hypothetical protein [Salmonella enterica]HBC0187591.1 hypothetical protein [Salmonella enterica subsp. enterica serovar Napoli]HBC0213120.1 hypothetical protein [Salmonella enterica subsp. enterica serovar Napoli]